MNLKSCDQNTQLLINDYLTLRQTSDKQIDLSITTQLPIKLEL